MIESGGTGMTSTNGSTKGDKVQQNTAEESESSQEISGLKQRVQELENQVKEKENRYLYLYAEFENFKKRAIKERSDLIKYGWESVARELLVTIDNLERAIAHVPSGTEKSLLDGLHMILEQFKSALQKQGVQHIESLQKAFDPNLHEAVGQEASEQPSGTVVKEHSRGYTLHGRLLRPARVVVSGGKPNDSGNERDSTKESS